MSKATKRKHVTKEVLDEFVLPEADKQIVKVVASRGNNLHEVQSPAGEVFLVSMPTKFRKNVWIKRGDYVMVLPIEEGDKVKAELTHILYSDQIKYIKEEGKWPAEFADKQPSQSRGGLIPDDMLPPSDADSEEGSAEEDMPVCNPNRSNVRYEQYSDSSSEEEKDDKDSESQSCYSDKQTSVNGDRTR